MKKVIKNLISISEALSAISVKVEKIAAVIEKETVIAKPAKKTADRKKDVSKVAKKKVAPNKKVAAKKKKAPKKAGKTVEVKKTEPKVEVSESGNILDNVYDLISSGGKGTTVSELKGKGGFTPRQVNNALYKLKQSGKIESLSRGVYMRKES